MTRLSLAGFVVGIGASLAGCAAGTIPDPHDALADYADAAARGDSAAIYAMLSESSRRSLTAADVKRMVADEREELKEQAQALEAPELSVTTRAVVRYADGETAALTIEHGELRIQAVDALPMGARTPTEALGALRKVLARRSYAGLMRVLSPTTRAAIEADLASLVEGLRAPEGLTVDVAADRATVQIPGGHEVRLRREAGLWLVDDFD